MHRLLRSSDSATKRAGPAADTTAESGAGPVTLLYSIGPEVDSDATLSVWELQGGTMGSKE